jgi:hypothetical protein
MEEVGGQGLSTLSTAHSLAQTGNASKRVLTTRKERNRQQGYLYSESFPKLSTTL